jgi:hypothetical protein
MTILLFSCTAPSSKEAYIEKFGSFIDRVQSEYKMYSEADWDRADKKFEKFTGDWYEKFKDDLSISDELVIKGYQTRYYIFKAADGTVDYFNDELRGDYEALREKVEYYIENDMQEDLEALKEKAMIAGDSAMEILGRIVEEIKQKK